MRTNKLGRTARAEILGLMVEDMSMRAISRVIGASKTTIVKSLEDAGEAFSDFQDDTLRNLTRKRGQVDEIWAFVYAKAKNVKRAKAARVAAGDCWTWMAINADRKSAPSSYVGKREGDAAMTFITDLASRLANGMQITSDGQKAYLQSVETACGASVDYATLFKI